jgi:hypothetical protein
VEFILFAVVAVIVISGLLVLIGAFLALGRVVAHYIALGWRYSRRRVLLGRRRRKLRKYAGWMPPTPEPTSCEKEMYKIHRDYVQHEDTLINHRTTLLLTIQGFLLTAIGLGLKQMYEITENKQCDSLPASFSGLWQLVRDGWPEILAAQSYYDLKIIEFNLYLYFLIFVGLTTSIIGRVSIGAAGDAISNLETNWNRYYYGIENPSELHFKSKALPGTTGGGSVENRRRGISFVRWMPTFFIWFWFLLLGTRLSFMLVEGACLKIATSTHPIYMVNSNAPARADR